MTAIGYGETQENGVDVLAELIIEASIFFETDQSKAKRCIEHAAELVRRRRSPESAESGSFATRGGLSKWQVMQLTMHIDSNIGARIHSGELAAIARISIGHLFRAFRVSFGTSPQSYIMRRRILRAEMLMLSTNEPLATIALDCGLSDQAHFSHVFRRLVGVSPNFWRRQHSSAGGRHEHPWPPQTAVAKTRVQMKPTAGQVRRPIDMSVPRSSRTPASNESGKQAQPNPVQ
jgi:AraC-like DNA-binding protein